MRLFTARAWCAALVAAGLALAVAGQLAPRAPTRADARDALSPRSFPP